MSNFIIKNGVLEKYESGVLETIMGHGKVVIIPESVTSIGEYALDYCEEIAINEKGRIYTEKIVKKDVITLSELLYVFRCL